jgi:hypothetical protein
MDNNKKCQLDQCLFLQRDYCEGCRYYKYNKNDLPLENTEGNQNYDYLNSF